MGLFSSKSTGYGAGDAQLAKDLSKATTKEQADKVARADGHKDAAAAQKWLRDRS